MADIENCVDNLCEQVAETCNVADAREVRESVQFCYGRDDLLDILAEKGGDDWFNWGKKVVNLPKDCKFLMRTPGKEYEDVVHLYSLKKKQEGAGDRQHCAVAEAVLARRSKEISRAKEKEVYRKYVREVPMQKRDRACPRTPNKYQDYGRRAWDGAVKQWKLDLYAWEKRFDAGDSLAELVRNGRPEAQQKTPVPKPAGKSQDARHQPAGSENEQPTAAPAQQHGRSQADKSCRVM